jgi:hypothetical protein
VVIRICLEAGHSRPKPRAAIAYARFRREGHGEQGSRESHASSHEWVSAIGEGVLVHFDMKQAREPAAILIAFIKRTVTPAGVEFDGRINGEPRPSGSLPATSRRGRRVPTAGPEKLLEQKRLPKAGEDLKAGVCLKKHGNALEGDKAIGGIGERKKCIWARDIPRCRPIGRGVWSHGGC